MKVAIMSDSHNHWDNLQEAIDWVNEEKCRYILFAGDLVKARGIEILSQFNGDVVLVWGNNQMAKKYLRKKVKKVDNLKIKGAVWEGEIQGLKFFMSHQPFRVEKKANSTHYDICVHGHTHQYREVVINKTLVICPGALDGSSISRDATFAILNTKDKSVEQFML